MSKVDELVKAATAREPKVSISVQLDKCTMEGLKSYLLGTRIDRSAFVSAAVDDALTRAKGGGHGQ